MTIGHLECLVMFRGPCYVPNSVIKSELAILFAEIHIQSIALSHLYSAEETVRPLSLPNAPRNSAGVRVCQ